jgi:hypothetical protein
MQSSSNVAETSVVKCGEQQRGGLAVKTSLVMYIVWLYVYVCRVQQCGGHAAECGDVLGYMCVGYSNVAGMLQSVEMYLAICVGYSNVAGRLQSAEMYVAICV